MSVPRSLITVVALMLLATSGTNARAEPPGKRLVEPTATMRLGPPDALVTILVLTDFQCPFCARLGPSLRDVQREHPNEVALVLRNMPLSFHTLAEPAAIAALAAHRQGKFWEMHDKLFAEQERWARIADADEESDAPPPPQGDRFEPLAQAIGLDLTRFAADRADPALASQVKTEARLATLAGLTGTPTFYINGLRKDGALAKDTVTIAVEAELALSKDLLDKGTVRDRVSLARTRTNAGERDAEAVIDWLLGGHEPPKKAAARKFDDTVWAVTLSGDEPSVGRPDALVTIVEFSEFQCPFCVKVQPTLKKLQEAFGDDLRLVFKHRPLEFHPQARPAALVSLAAHRQKRFWKAAEYLFGQQARLADLTPESFAEAVALDLKRLQKDLKDPKLAESITRDLALAEDVTATGTPTFFINGRKVPGAQPFEAFEAVVLDELDKARTKVKAGTPKAKLYSTLVKAGKRRQAIEEKVHAFPNDDRPAVGAPRGDITLTVFSDHQCPFCARFWPMLEALVADPDWSGRVRVVHRFFPLDFHPQARPAALALLAAHAQGRYVEMNRKLYARSSELGTELFEDLAAEVGLDMDRFDADLAKGDVAGAIAHDLALGQEAGVKGTPTLFANGRLVDGSARGSLEALKATLLRTFGAKKKR